MTVQLYPIKEVEAWDCRFANDVYDQAKHIISHISNNIDAIREEWQPDVLKSLENIADRVHKAVIRTPLKNDGSVHWEAVPPGDSVWITAKHGPLAGGHILITKRPDGLAVLSDAMKRKKVKTVPKQAPFDPTSEAEGKGRTETKRDSDEAKGKKDERKDYEKEAAARRHMAFPVGKLKVSKRSEEEEKRRQELEKEEQPKREAYRELMKEARSVAKTAKDSYMAAVGINDSKLSREKRKIVAETAKQHFVERGVDEEHAERIAKAVSSTLAQEHRKASEAAAVRRRERIREQMLHRLQNAEEKRLNWKTEDSYITDNDGVQPVVPTKENEYGHGMPETPDLENVVPEDASFAIPSFSPEEAKHLTDVEIESRIKNAIDKQKSLGQTQDVDRTSDELITQEGDDLNIHVGPDDESREAFEVALQDEEQLKAAEEEWRRYIEVKAKAKEVKDTWKQIPKKKFYSPSTLEDLKMELGKGISDEEFEQLSDEYASRVLQNTHNASIYEALNEHWNDETGNTLATPIVDGASAALSVLMQAEEMQKAGLKFEVGRLVDAIGPEAAARMMAFEARKRLTKDDFMAFKSKVRDSNIQTLDRTEKEALNHHAQLQKQMEIIDRDIDEGRLSEVTGKLYKSDNLDRQRRNLGVALGSMSASAAFYDALSRTAGDKVSTRMDILVGDSELALKNKLTDLGFTLGSSLEEGSWEIKSGRGTTVGYVDYRPNVGYGVHTTAKRLQRFVSKMETNKQIASEWEDVKNDTSSTDGYTSPMVKTHFDDGTPIQFRQEQRNDLEWLKRSGGGVIARTTGAGKTLTSLAFMGHHISNDPNYRGMIAAPNKNLDQWESEAKKFTDLDVVKCPAKSSYEEREKLYRNLKPGQVLLIGHDHMSRRDVDFLTMQDDAGNPLLKFNGVHIDEPQEMTARKSGNLGASARRIMKIDADNRVALTATPSKKGVVEAYNLINWTNPKRLGFRTRFVRRFGGFGEGTNAQDSALQASLQRELEPFISGGKSADLPFKVNHDTVDISQTDAQKQRAQEIEKRVPKIIEQEFADLSQSQLDYYQNRYGNRWKSVIKDKAMRKVLKEHRDNLHGGEAATNGKINAFMDQVQSMRDSGRKKHIVFVDSHAQRMAVKEALSNAGMQVTSQDVSNRQFFDISRSFDRSRTEEQKKAWQEHPDEAFLVIDRSSSIGHNLQQGDAFHFLGLPTDTAEQAQALGRILRTDPTDKRDSVDIRHYSYDDSPFENQRRNELYTQMKIMQATAPAVVRNLG